MPSHTLKFNRPIQRKRSRFTRHCSAGGSLATSMCRFPTPGSKRQDSRWAAPETRSDSTPGLWNECVCLLDRGIEHRRGGGQGPVSGPDSRIAQVRSARCVLARLLCRPGRQHIQGVPAGLCSAMSASPGFMALPPLREFEAAGRKPSGESLPALPHNTGRLAPCRYYLS
jgi:hypothetical protein